MPSNSPAEEFDLVVIGTGPAGEKAAAQAAYFGKRVAIVERAPEPGGAGVHTGTLPSKTLRETAMYLSGYQARELYGVAVKLDRLATLEHLMARKDVIAASESARIRGSLLRHGVSYVHGKAKLADANTVLVDDGDGGRTLHAAFVLIATGSRPYHPKEIDFSDDRIHDSDEILNIHRLPDRLIVLGAGVIGCEYTCMFAALGTRVTLVDARDKILGFLDDELVSRLTDSMRALGVELRLGVKWPKVEAKGDVVSVGLSDGSTLESDQVLFTAGRVGNTEDVGLDVAGVKVDARGYIVVDEHYRTSVPTIMAAGDVIGFPALASVSMEQGRVAVCHAFGFGYKRAVSHTMPYGIYTIPEVSGVGATESSLREEKRDYVVGRALYSQNPRGKIVGDTDGMTKLIVCATTRKLLGVHVVGENATELVHIGQTVLHLEGTVDLFIDMVFNFPTLAESYKYAAYDCLAAFSRRAAQ
ncbi:MAG TPA: Si-specific NAD(P)(+) transhydrogenase [Polyangiaceae bacterium]|jgi:NAD(P) transhydrogenase|nr:Si-specific NAD(P)(+) transhydrogenase [Polyangiaceae bacterium]